jgi:3-oxoacyl-(acyl-carrier-protein) synthase
MKIAGAGWVSTSVTGTVLKQLKHEHAGELRQALKDQGVLTDRVKNAGKFDESTTRAFCAAALALYDADFSNDWKTIALVGTGSDECTTANRMYFEDYAGHGRQLARANLFIYTLPTSPLAEIAIHFKLGGPLFYTSESSVSAARRLLAFGDADAVLTLWMEADCTLALLWNKEAGIPVDEKASLPETPQQWIEFLEDTK